MTSGVLGVIAIWLWGIVVGLHVGLWYEQYLNRKKKDKTMKTDTVEKVIRDGKVALVLAKGSRWWSGWASLWEKTAWYLNPRGGKEKLIFHPKMVQMVEEGRVREITTEWIEQELGLKGVWLGSRSDLTIEWVPAGTKFRIKNDKGVESIEIFYDEQWMTA